MDRNIQQTYRSQRGAFLESLHVFLINSGAQAFLADEANAGNGPPLRCLEIGFGTGLNFLLLASMAATNKSPLVYLGYEASLLSCEVLSQLKLDESLSTMKQHSVRLDADCVRNVWHTICNAVREYYRSETPSNHLTFDIGPSISAQVRVGDARLFLSTEAGEWDAIFFDPFSPQVAPSLWTESVFAETFRLLRPGGRLTTYSVSSEVRRLLTSIGFSVQRVPGPPNGKREVLIAARPKV